MTGSINAFKSSFRTDLARPSRFDVRIVPPITLYLMNYLTVRDLSYRCEIAQLPGRTLSTIEQKTYGPIEKFPNLTTYNDIDLTFIVGDIMEEKRFFDSWLEFINPTTSNNFRYKSDYSTTISVNQYDVGGKQTYSAEMFDAFPISINQLDLDWSSEGYHKLTVTFAYTYWKNYKSLITIS
jgi:hypothetical protein